MIRIRSKKRDEVLHKALDNEKYYGRLIAEQKERAISTAVRMEQELAAVRAELADVRDENAALREIIKALRYRIYTLLRSADLDAESIGMERITDAGQYDGAYRTADTCQSAKDAGPEDDADWKKNCVYKFPLDGTCMSETACRYEQDGKCTYNK